MNKIRTCGFLLLLFFALPALAWGYYSFGTHRPNYSLGKIDSSLVDFTIRPGEKVYEIAERLKELRLINSSVLFKLYVRMNNFSSKLQAGDYRIPRNLSIVEVTNLLQHGTFDVRLTFPEGWRKEEMGLYLAETFKGRNPNYDLGLFLSQTAAIEGRLFPDTYVVPYDIEIEDLIRLMRENFERKVDSKMRADIGQQGLSLDQVIILSSIVERESLHERDRPIIAGILVKRLRSGLRIDADATVQYAVASKFPTESVKIWWPKELTASDLELDSPYNTRKVVGLPPSPIANPGLESMKAVTYPVETPYWYYLSDTKGETHYAKTLVEHENNVSRYLR